jgi:hypothetical protein
MATSYEVKITTVEGRTLGMVGGLPPTATSAPVDPGAFLKRTQSAGKGEEGGGGWKNIYF